MHFKHSDAISERKGLFYSLELFSFLSKYGRLPCAVGKGRYFGTGKAFNKVQDTGALNILFQFQKRR
jgi:hypothetical protein